jgi:hypothetical protein
MEQMRTGKNIRGFHACLHATGEPAIYHEKQRIAREKQALKVRIVHHSQLGDQWRDHFECVAGSLRVLPPSARRQLLLNH